MKRIIIFASGSGSNAENIINYFNKTKTAKVVHVLCNSKKAKVFDRCERLNTPSSHFTRDEFLVTDKILNFLKENGLTQVYNGGSWINVQTMLDS